MEWKVTPGLPAGNFTLPWYHKATMSGATSDRIKLDDVQRRQDDLEQAGKTRRGRELLDAGKKDEYRKYKAANFPAISFCGVFPNRRRKVDWPVTYSGFQQCDFDDIKDTGLDNLLALRDAAFELPFVLLSFISPSGRGIKVNVRTAQQDNPTLESHTRAWCYANEVVAHHLGGLAYDRSTSDHTRLQFLCHTPEGTLYRPDAAILVVPDDWELPERYRPHKRAAAGGNGKYQGRKTGVDADMDDALAGNIFEYLQTALPPSGENTYDDWFGTAAAVWVKDGADAAAAWIAGSNRPDEKVNSPERLEFHLGGLIQIARRWGWKYPAWYARKGRNDRRGALSDLQKPAATNVRRDADLTGLLGGGGDAPPPPRSYERRDANDGNGDHHQSEGDGAGAGGGGEVEPPERAGSDAACAGSEGAAPSPATERAEGVVTAGDWELVDWDTPTPAAPVAPDAPETPVDAPHTRPAMSDGLGVWVHCTGGCGRQITAPELRQLGGKPLCDDCRMAPAMVTTPVVVAAAAQVGYLASQDGRSCASVCRFCEPLGRCRYVLAAA